PAGAYRFIGSARHGATPPREYEPQLKRSLCQEGMKVLVGRGVRTFRHVVVLFLHTRAPADREEKKNEAPMTRATLPLLLGFGLLLAGPALAQPNNNAGDQEFLNPPLTIRAVGNYRT